MVPLAAHKAVPLVPPEVTMLGALLHYLRGADPGNFQPMNANFGLLEPLDSPARDKAKKRARLAERALAEIADFGLRIADSTAGVSNPQSAIRNPQSISR